MRFRHLMRFHLMRSRHVMSVCACAVVSAAALTLTCPDANAQTPIRFAVEGSLTALYAPLLVAEDRGFYKAEGITVSFDIAPSAVTPSVAATDAIARVASGAADMALADINALARTLEQNPGTPLKAVFIVTNKPGYAVLGRKSRGIAGPKDLEGKRIGAPPNGMASLLWPAFARLNDIDASKVKIETIASAIREPMLAAGQVDAVTGTSFVVYLSLKERGVPLNDVIMVPMADHGLPLYGDAIIVNTAFAEAHPDTVKGFLRAVVKGMRKTIRSPTRAVDSVVKRNEAAKKDVELERLRMILQDNIVTDEVQAEGLGGVNAGRFARGIDLLTQTFKAKNKLDPAEVFDASFLAPAAERKIGTSRPG